MRLTSALGSIAALAAATAAAAPVAAAATSQYGSWAVEYSTNSAANGWKQQKFSAVYSLDQSTATKTVSYLPSTGETVTVDPESFVASYNGTHVILQQTVDIEGTQTTIYGSAPLETTCGGTNGRLCTGSATVEVTEATA
ncbi:uncharacterized protein BKCO1_790003 [Diplodia corticola]|uniref:Uncharacterized protein n=1 Tax=Diplodia corticola TaxID=236234 RepID=A0A1J9QKT9_9PEZI|nr:uncharacterized protein BKCO1_790003 [Diplodia corticola]OJD29494.1 hypothetical protein BKCO1_790003 [Diplodia corticola]